MSKKDEVPQSKEQSGDVDYVTLRNEIFAKFPLAKKACDERTQLDNENGRSASQKKPPAPGLNRK
jgi:hypothetical protein